MKIYKFAKEAAKAAGEGPSAVAIVFIVLGSLVGATGLAGGGVYWYKKKQAAGGQQEN